MVVMSTPGEGGEDSQDQNSWYILDETGDTTLGETQVANDAKENLNTPNQLDRRMKTVSISDGSSTSRQLRIGRKKGKRKRVAALTPVGPAKKKMTQTPLSRRSPLVGPKGSKKRKARGRKKSVVVLDSDSEPETSPGKSHSVPDVSIVEIDDDSQSIIVLSDDEVGVCSGSVSKAPKSHNPFIDRQPFVSKVLSKIKDLPVVPAKRQVQPTGQPGPSTSRPVVIEDLTGKYITKDDKAPDNDQNKNVELYQPLANKNSRQPGSLRPIVIDGCNVAFGHSRQKFFSSLGLKICVDYFKEKGHEVIAFVPQFRKSHPSTLEPQLLDVMEKEGTVSFTPSRRVDGKMVVSYDDRFIVQYADATGGVVVSRDNYRDVVEENPEWRDTVHKRLLMFTWANDTLLFPKDPLGRGGPTLDEFLKF